MTKHSTLSPDKRFCVTLHFVDRGLKDRVYCNRCKDLIMTRYTPPGKLPAPMDDGFWEHVKCMQCDGEQ